MEKFSYQDYKKIITKIQKYLPIVSFDEAKSMKKYCVIRHDVEYSPERALSLAKLEKKIGISTTYLFQIRNNTYNSFSKKNLEIIKEISELGHTIGLHYNHDNVVGYLPNLIFADAKVLEMMLGGNIKIETFSIHRPKKEHLSPVVNVDGMINCCDEDYFCYFEGDKPKLPVTYLADSNHQWKYGDPHTLNLKRVNKLQINFHPFSWTEQGADVNDVFYTLSQEKQDEMIESIDYEIKNYPKFVKAYWKSKIYEKERYMVGGDTEPRPQREVWWLRVFRVFKNNVATFL
jgi:hypothetical protein